MSDRSDQKQSPEEVKEMVKNFLHMLEQRQKLKQEKVYKACKLSSHEPCRSRGTHVCQLWTILNDVELWKCKDCVKVM